MKIFTVHNNAVHNNIIVAGAKVKFRKRMGIVLGGTEYKWSKFIRLDKYHTPTIGGSGRFFEADVKIVHSPSGDSNFLTRSMTKSRSVLVLIKTRLSYRYACFGEAKKVYGEPTLVKVGIGDFKKPVGRWRDYLWVMNPGDGLSVTPSGYSDCLLPDQKKELLFPYFVDFDGNILRCWRNQDLGNKKTRVDVLQELVI